MKILGIFAGNLAAGPLTVRLPGQVGHPPGFHGPVRIDTAKCICCGMCDYACVSEAVKVTPAADGCEWAYRPGRCTYCGKCVQFCPVEALSMETGSPPAYTAAGELDDAHFIIYPPCAECGNPTQPVGEAVLLLAFKEINDEIRAWLRLCPRCRRKKHMKDISSALKKGETPEGGFESGGSGGPEEGKER